MRKSLIIASIFIVLLITILPSSGLAKGPEKKWFSFFVCDNPDITLAEGTYTYRTEFEWTYPLPGNLISEWYEFEVSGGADLYEGYVVLRGFEAWARVDGQCERIDPVVINPDQPIRFHIGWLTDKEMTRLEAKVLFESMTVKFTIKDNSPFDLIQCSPIYHYNKHSIDIIRHNNICSWVK